MKLNKENYTKEEVQNLLIKVLNKCETEMHKTYKVIGECGLINFNGVLRDINTVKEEIKGL